MVDTHHPAYVPVRIRVSSALLLVAVRCKINDIDRTVDSPQSLVVGIGEVAKTRLRR